MSLIGPSKASPIASVGRQLRRPLRVLPRDERELDAIHAADLAGLW
jgi:hypothetical protein